MATLVIPRLFQLVVGFLALYTVYRIYWELTVGASRRKLIKEHGCKPIRKWPNLNPLVDSMFGWKIFRENMRAVKEHKMLELVQCRFESSDKTYCTKIMASTVISTSEPENLKTMLAVNFKDWALPDKRKSAFLPFLGSGIFTSDGAAWQHSRELLRPNFVRSQVGDLETFETHVNHLIQAIPRDGSSFDIQALFFNLTIDSATEFLFGESTNCLVPGNSDASSYKFAEAWNRGQAEVAINTRFGPFLSWLTTKPQFTKDSKYVHDFADRYVRKGLEYRKTHDVEKSTSEEGGRYVFLHELVKRTSDPLQIRSELLNVLLAGRDTTASLLSNVWFMLAKRPEVWAKLRAEVNALDGERPTLTQIKDMKYLKAVLNESLRLHPVVPGNMRMAIVDTVLPFGGGLDGKSPLFVPAKTNVQYSVYTMQRNKEYYGEDSNEFRPERWETLRPGWEYLPFNGGPRICIGQQFALTEASYTTIRLIQEFKSLESRDSGPWEEWLALTCAVNGAKVALTPA